MDVRLQSIRKELDAMKELFIFIDINNVCFKDRLLLGNDL